MAAGKLDALELFEQGAFGRAMGRIENRLEGVFDVRGGQRPAVVELDIGPQIELKRLPIDPLPALGELGLQAQILIGAEQGVVNQIADAHGVGVGGVTRVELRRIGFDADNQKVGRKVAMG